MIASTSKLKKMTIVIEGIITRLTYCSVVADNLTAVTPWRRSITQPAPFSFGPGLGDVANVTGCSKRI
jgi:hypothetical protein